ncbi:reverse transcriptase domain-containing protein [Tanacetum coccineum]
MMGGWRTRERPNRLEAYRYVCIPRRLDTAIREFFGAVDKAGAESPLEFWRSWYVEGHFWSGVISSVLAQRYLRNSLTKGDEGLSSRGTKLNLIFITAEVTFTKPKQPTYAKGPTEIHGINRRRNKGLQAFMDRFKSEGSHIKEVPLVLRISTFMHGHGHPELAKKLNDKIPKTVDKMFERVRAFIRVEVAAGSAEMVCPSQGDKGDKGHNTNKCYQLKKQIKEAVASGKLAHLVKDIRPNNQRNGNQGRNGVKVITMIREEGNLKRPFEEGTSGLMNELTFPTIPRSQLMNEPIILEGIVEGNQVRRILVDGGSSLEIMTGDEVQSPPEHPKDKSGLVASAKLTRVELNKRSRDADLSKDKSGPESPPEFRRSWIYVDGGSSSEVMYEHCFRNLRAKTRAKLKESRTPLVGVSGEDCNNDNEEINSPRMPKDRRSTMTSHRREDHPSPNTSTGFRRNDQPGQKRRSMTPADMTRIPHSIAEHKLKTYPHIKPRMLRKQSIALDRRRVVKDEVAEWLKVGIVRKVRYPMWVANPVLVKKPDDNWRMCIDFKDLNKACPKDLYPLSKIDWKIESLMGFNYKYFLDAYKGYHQIQMTKKDEDKMAFHTDEGVFYYTKIPFGLKNAGATYQRLVDTIFEGQIRGRRSILGNEEADNGATNLNGPKEGGRTHGLPISGQQSSQRRFISGKTLEISPNPLRKQNIAGPYNQGYHRQTHKSNIKQSRATRRLAKWGIKLEAYGIKYAPRSVIKGQVLADFLAEDNSTQVKASGSNDTLIEGKSREEQEAPETKTPKNLGTEIDIWKLYTDGASNEHGSGEGLILIDLEGAEYSYALRLNFTNSDNDAEYKALLELNERSVDTVEVNAIIKEATITWMTPIQEYIEHGSLSEDVAKA